VADEKLSDYQDNAVEDGLPDWFGSLVNAWHEKKVEVITFNYDLLVEMEATSIITIDERIPKQTIDEQDLYPYPIASVYSRLGGVIIGGGHETFRYHKLHGSLNWYYSGSQEYYGESIYTIPVRKGKWEKDDKAMLTLTRDLTTLVIPPTVHKSLFFSNELVRGIWRAAGESLRKAERVFCLGYSFPLTDMMVRYFFLTNQPPGDVEFYWVNIEEHKDGLDNILPRSYHVHDCYVDEEAPIEKFAKDYVNGNIKE